MLVGKKSILVSGKLKVAIVGDSFSHYYEDTYLEFLCNDLDLDVVDHIGFKGGSQYRIYKRFLSQLDKNPDIIICIHTEFARLYLQDFCINYTAVEKKMKTAFTLNKDIYEAADKYYKYLYNDESSKFYHNLTIVEMQRLCKIKNIKMINIPAFYNKYINKYYGLWLSIQPEGLLSFANLTDIKNIKNHLTNDQHIFLSKKFLPYIKKYIYEETDTFINIKF